LICCQSAAKDFRTIIDTLGGEGERIRAKNLLEDLIDEIVPDGMSDRLKNLDLSGKIKARSRAIFGTGDYLQVRAQLYLMTNFDGVKHVSIFAFLCMCVSLFCVYVFLSFLCLYVCLSLICLYSVCLFLCISHLCVVCLPLSLCSLSFICVSTISLSLCVMCSLSFICVSTISLSLCVFCVSLSFL